ncbi:undecaprenyl/decaprenyl-phosphate alpha-N-acetylglucosaminyl 1-phosphate transferase, partial [Candidatus Sumerlaeota bacterium]|nr:undecaprenyl/decaprenyl-phosphate alpha-N-acetylglucosaminyl 1-phosphate transferase [Candidatus Sumerlaeota bacterium]
MPDYLRSPTCWLLFLGAGLATGMLTPVVMWLAKWIGAVDGGGYRKVGACGIARLGGPAIALPFVVACLLGLWGPTGMLGLIEAQGPSLLVLAFGCAAIVGLGIVDDSRGLRARHKLLVQIAVAAVVCASGHVVTSFALPFVGTIHLGYVFGTIFTLFWIVGLINAFNLIDGVDGLAAGIALIGSVALAILAAINGATFVVLLCLALSGSLLAFLPFNFYPARV